MTALCTCRSVSASLSLDVPAVAVVEHQPCCPLLSRESNCVEVFLGTFSGVPPKKHLSHALIARLLRKTNIGIEREGVKLRLAKT